MLYLVVSCASMPRSCRGYYQHVAIVEREDGKEPMQIRNTSKQRIVAARYGRRVGSQWSAARRAIDELCSLYHPCNA